jgi:hypothetical protein
MTDIFGDLDSRNGVGQKCIGRWLREIDSFKKYTTFCTLSAIMQHFCSVLVHTILPNIYRP